MMDYGELVAGIVLVVVLVGLTIFMRREARAKDVGGPDAETQARQDVEVVLITSSSRTDRIRPSHDS
jgi:hypothetical protein